jgi:RNA polymerase sigma factor (sigma-70 family)
VTDTEPGAPRTQRAPSEVEERVLALIPSLRRYTALLVRDVHDQQDVVQETLARVLTAADRLSEDAMPAYALAVARNLVATRGRDSARFRAHAPRLAETASPEQPDAAVLAGEERAALGEALAALPSEHRDVLVAHAVHGRSLSAIAGASEPGAVAARLARTRARVRVDYVLALRGVRLPSERCRMVLLALSAGDRRRQAALDAGEHLLTCPVCREVSVPLLKRKSALAGLLPFGAAPFAVPDLGGSGSAGAGAAGSAAPGSQSGSGGAAGTTVGVTQVAAASVAVTSVIAGLVAVSALTQAPGTVAIPPAATRPAAASPASSEAAPTPPPSADPSAGPSRDATGCLDRLPVGSLASAAGRDVCLSGVLVVSVPADEGFWVRTEDGAEAWVQLQLRGESPPDIDAGQRVNVRGTLVRHGSDYADAAGVTQPEGAAALTRQGGHIAAEPAEVRIVG